jgi:isopenicillin-N epimerase
MVTTSGTPIDPEAARDFMMSHDITFLNHGSFGACPGPIFATYQQWQRELEAQPVAFLGRRLPELLAQARAPLAACVGASEEDLVFIPNATHGVNIIAHSLDLQPGDEVLATDHEYGASDKIWRYRCAQKGARYINQPITLPITDEATFVEQLWAGVTNHTRLIFLSHITSPTAIVFPVAAICQRAREAGILTVIDGAHAPGQIPLDLAAVGADFDRVKEIRKLANTVERVRMIGTAAVDLAYLACGRADGLVMTSANPWDTNPGKLLVLEAGGQVQEIRKNRSKKKLSSFIVMGRYMTV